MRGVAVTGPLDQRIAARQPVRRLLAELAPDRIEVSDRLTLAWVGEWARAQGIPAVAVVHEHLGALMRLYLRRWVPVEAGVRAANHRLAERLDTLVCASRYVASEFPAAASAHVPLGVDLETFHPSRRDPALRERLLGGHADVLVVLCSRLSVEAAGSSCGRRRGGAPPRRAGAVGRRRRRAATGTP